MRGEPIYSCQKEPPSIINKINDGREAKAACLQCGKTLAHRKPSRRGKYCSHRCRGESRRVKRICLVCGAQCRNRSVSSTCSRPCGYELRKRKLRSPKECPSCGKEFWPTRQVKTGWQKHCSLRCAFEAIRAKRIDVPCLQCGKIVRRAHATTKRVRLHFCTQECMKVYLRGPNSPLYRGESDPNRGGQWRRLAEKIRERDGHCCQRCNRTQAENKQRLSVDHIVPWRSFTDKAAANDPRNLVSLCRRCHSVKTTLYERLWLRGDVIGFEQYRKAIQLPPLFARVEIPA